MRRMGLRNGANYGQQVTIRRSYQGTEQDGTQGEDDTQGAQGEDDIQDEAQVRSSAKYPVLLQRDKVRPGVYQGKKGIPLTIKTETWEKIKTEKQESETTEETSKTSTVEVDTETEKKPIYEVRAIMDYKQWDEYDEKGKQIGYRYLVAWKGYSDVTWQSHSIHRGD